MVRTNSSKLKNILKEHKTNINTAAEEDCIVEFGDCTFFTRISVISQSSWDFKRNNNTKKISRIQIPIVWRWVERCNLGLHVISSAFDR